MMLSKGEWMAVAVAGVAMTLICSRVTYLLVEGMAAVLVMMQP